MTDHVFGKILSRTLIAYENDIAIQISSVNAVTVHSSLSDAVANLSPIVAMSSYNTNGSSPYEITYNLPPISDPAPSADRKSWQLWERVEYKLSSSGDAQPDYRAIEVSRASTGESLPGTSKTDLKALFPALASYLSDPRLDDILELVNLQMKLDLKAQKIEFSKARNLTETKLALAYLAVAMSAEALYARTGQDVYYQRSIMYRKLYSTTLSKITVPYDSDGDGAVDETKQAQPSFWYTPR